jgi:hypothetical protein
MIVFRIGSSLPQSWCQVNRGAGTDTIYFDRIKEVTMPSVIEISKILYIDNIETVTDSQESQKGSP